MGAKANYHRILVLALAAVFAVIPSVAVPFASAENGLVADAPTLDLTALGVNSTIAFYGEQATESLTVPVPAGLIPDVLVATLELPLFLSSGAITVSQDDRTISRVELPPDNNVPIVLPLAGAVVRDNAVTLTLRTYLVGQVGYCIDFTNPLRLVDTAVTYVGVEQPPTTVADFLPPILRKVTLYLPPEPTQAESDAVVRLATAVVAQYGTATTEVAVARLPEGQTSPPEPSLPLERQIVVAEQDEAGVALQGDIGVPSLAITGPAGELANQVRLISSDLSRIALSSKAVVGPLKDVPQLPGNLTTIRDLGQPGVNATALSPQVIIGVDQTRLGRAAHDVRVHLIGSHTPVPQSLGGQVVVSVGGETVDRWVAETDGTIDRWVTVPDDLLQRYTNVVVEVDISGDVGGCGEFRPITLTIDGATAVESAAANPPVPYGFQSLPQTLMPRVQVGIDGPSFDDTARAVGIMTGLQRLSALPLDTVVTNVADALGSSAPAVVITPSGWDHPEIDLPLQALPDGEIAVASVEQDVDPTSLTLVPNLRFASMQTVFDGSRTVLIATSTDAPEQLDQLLAYLNADGDARRWSRLTGDVVVAPQGRDPVMVSTDYAPVVAEEPAAQSNSRSLGWIGGAAALLVLLGALVFWRARAKSRPTPDSSPGG